MRDRRAILRRSRRDVRSKTLKVTVEPGSRPARRAAPQGPKGLDAGGAEPATGPTMLAVGSPAADLTAILHVSRPQTGSLASKLAVDALELLERVIGHLDRDVIAEARELLEQHLDVLVGALPCADHRIEALVRMIERADLRSLPRGT